MADQAWIILDQVEKSIKEKIETLGTPLSEWDVRINYGIKTGFNQAFIISRDKRQEIIDKDPKSAELIRPILRGRDIRRYSYMNARLFLINTHNGIKGQIPPINVNDYPGVKKHFDQYFDRLTSRYDQGVTPYNLRDCSYMEDFNKLKIIYPNMTKYLPFLLDDEGFFTNQKCFILTGTSLHKLVAVFNSKLFKFAFRDHFPELLGGTRELSKIFFETIRISRTILTKLDGIEPMVDKVKKFRLENKNSIAIEDVIEEAVFEAYSLSSQDRTYILSRFE